MSYVDGYTIPIRKKDIATYKRIATAAGKVWRDHGALDYKECIGDDMELKGCTPLAKVMRLKKGETLVFAYILYKSRAHRDKVNAKVMKDPRIASVDFTAMPFDPKRMGYAGYKVVVDYGRKRRSP